MTTAPFRLLNHEEFNALTVDAKIAYIAKATAYLEHQRRMFEESVSREDRKPGAGNKIEP